MKTKWLIVLLTISFLAKAQINLIVNDYTSEDGLPHNSVYGSLKDSEGLMWFATWYGLSSFDGVKFQSYNSRDNYLLDIPPHKLQRVLEADSAELWVKTIDHKIYLFNKIKETYLNLDNIIQYEYDISPRIIKIQKMPDGNLLMLNKDRVLLTARIKNGKPEVGMVGNYQNVPANISQLNQFLENATALSWVGRDYKLLQLEKGDRLKTKPADFITRKLAIKSSYDFTAATTFTQDLYLADQEGNLIKINSTNGDLTKEKLFNSPIQNILVNGKQQYLFSGNAIYRRFEGRMVKLTELPSGSVVSTSMIDSYEICWWTVNNSLLISYDPINGTLQKYSIPNGIVLPDIKLLDGKELGMFVLARSGEVFWVDRVNMHMVNLNSTRYLNSGDHYKLFYDIYLDNDKVLWLSSTADGILKVNFPQQQFNLLKIPYETAVIYDNAVKSIAQVKNHDIWIGKRNGEVYHMDPYMKVKGVFSANSNFNIGSVYHFMEDRTGNIWMSTKGNGLVKASPDQTSKTGFRFDRFLNNPYDMKSISGNDVYYTFQDSKGRIWVGLFGGGLNLITQKDGNISFSSPLNSFTNYPKHGMYLEVRNMVEDDKGRIWVGTSDGLMSFPVDFDDPNSIPFEIYRNDEMRSNVSDNDIYALYKDSEGGIWISVFGGGLNKLESYDSKTSKPVFSTYRMVQSLNSDVILSMVEDNERYLWLATENGIARFDKKKKTFRNFDKHDGFMDIRMEEESAIKCLNGQLWFGSRMGVLAFDPSKLENYKSNYNTLIVDFLISSKSIKTFTDAPIIQQSIKYTKDIRLKYFQNNFVVEFAALNYYNLNRVTYRYILKGFEEEWHYNGKNRLASYPNMPPGEYDFIVQSVDEANSQLQSEASIHIKIYPPWWKSWWAYMIYSILFLAAGISAARLVLYMIKMKNEVYIEQRVSELKIRFFTNISHELRTPLTLIMGPIHELKEKHIKSEKGKDYISLIEKSAQQMLQLVNQILDFRKIQNGKMILNVSRFNLNELVESFSREFEIMSEEKDISLEFHLTDDDMHVWADRDRLEIVLRNIFSNAFKFTESGGSIFVTSELDEQEQKCYIKIEDTGVGIPQNKLTEIFERFTQASGSRNAYQGSGIGLALSKEIMALHHGEIRAENKSDKGSIFTLEIPISKEVYQEEDVNFLIGGDEPLVVPVNDLNNSFEETEEEIAEISSNLPVVLIVEDNRDLCAMLRLQLEDKFQVHIANNGEEGLRKVEKIHPDLVVTDLMMPIMSGMEMLKKLRDDFKISHIPVVILTAKHNEEAKIQALNLGANSYITKPFNKEYLIATIERLLNDRMAFKEKIVSLNRDLPKVEDDTYETYLVKKDLQLLEKIHLVIEENMQNSDFNIDNIAENLGLSRSAFFKKLKSLTGLAPVDLIKEVRLNKSVELMSNSDLTITEIAFEVGFKEAGYFGKCFRKKFNQTPSEFMHLVRKRSGQSN